MAELVGRALADLEHELVTNRWLAPLKGSFPQVPVRDALPPADEALAYRMMAVRGTPDVVYCCLRDAGGTWGWRVMATG